MQFLIFKIVYQRKFCSNHKPHNICKRKFKGQRKKEIESIYFTFRKTKKERKGGKEKKKKRKRKES